MADEDVETIAFTIESDRGGEDEIAVPAGLVELLAEGDQPAAEVVGDVTTLSMASRAHHLVHHGEGGEEVADDEARMMELFEERFGVTFGEATGHQH